MDFRNSRTTSACTFPQAGFLAVCWCERDFPQQLFEILNTTASGRIYPRCAQQMSATGKKTGQICWREKLSVSDLESSSLAGFLALIWSNLCTRHIPDKLTPRGHHDWPDKRVTRQLDSGMPSEPITGSPLCQKTLGDQAGPFSPFRVAVQFGRLVAVLL